MVLQGHRSVYHGSWGKREDPGNLHAAEMSSCVCCLLGMMVCFVACAVVAVTFRRGCLAR